MPRSSTNAQSKFFVFTINNPSGNQEQALVCLYETQEASYIIFGRETGAGGTVHLQGYVEFLQRRRLSAVKRLEAFRRAHLEVRRGTSAEASAYCKKDGDYVERGQLSVAAQGRRSDLDAVFALINGGASRREIALAYPAQFIRYHRGIEAAMNAVASVHFEVREGPFPWDIDVRTSHVFRGPSGIGKTEYAKYLLPRALFVSHLDQLAQYDPAEYDGIIFDDLSFTHLHREAQIHLLDFDNPRHIHVRYSTAFIPAGTRKIFTTNLSFIFATDDPAISRRVHYHTLE